MDWSNADDIKRYNHDYYLENHDHHDALRKAWYQAHKEICREYSKIWLDKVKNDPLCRAKHYAATRLWRLRNKEKDKAHHLLAKAIKKGKIIREACSVCGTEQAQGHHNDYNQPLAVIWLCPLHHMALH
jgi:hypothetical protein